jgi:uncharacterized BrkB/YihY/UPF0761 family membrane protein
MAALGRRYGTRGADWLKERRAVSAPVDLVVRIYERDRSRFGSILGSALAFRLFLFMLSLTVFSVGLGQLLVHADLLDDEIADTVGVTGALAVEVDEALEGSQTGAWLLVLTGLGGTLWAGKNLASALVAVSSATWDLSGRPRGTIRVIARTIGLIVLLVVSTSLLAVVRRETGLAVATTSLAVVFIIYTSAWFVITLGLPRSTPDPAAVLPGAALVGTTLVLMQGATQLYLAPKLDAKSELMGGLGIAAVAMGWLFFASRVMVASLSVNAVVYEEYGSVSKLILEVPGLRQIPRRIPAVARYFDLQVEPEPEPDDGNSPTDGSS